jgi:signal transduction histidine kinase
MQVTPQEPHGRVRLLEAVAVTTLVLWLLTWISEETFGPAEAVGVVIWVAAVLASLTMAARRIDPASIPIWRQLAVLALTAGVTSSLVHVVFFVTAAVMQDRTDGSGGGLLSAAVIGFFDGDALFGFWALFVELPRRIGAERRLEVERQALRQEAELARIRAALEPHFVLNTLNTIAGLVTDEPRKAQNLIGTLGDLLRDTMQDAGRNRHTVREEVRWLRGFAQILKTRHHGRLTFEWSVDGSMEDCVLPMLLLQPLLENAVQHGALRREDGGRVGVRIGADGDRLRCTVEDDGPGFDPAGARQEGRGLELVRRRLALESPDASLQLNSSADGTRVHITLPRRTR